MADESTTTTNSATPASHKTGVRKKARSKKKASKKTAKKAGAKAKTNGKAKKSAANGKRPGKYPDVANRIRLLKQQSPKMSAQDIANDIGCSVNYVYLKWGRPKRGKSKKGTIEKAAVRTNGGGAEVEFRRALRLVGLERARQLLEAFEREE